MTYCIINCTTSNEEEAKKIAKTLIENKLIACCTIIPKVTSIYVWNNNLNEDSEVLMVMKTKTELFSEIQNEIKKIHSYDVPEIICIPVIEGSYDYLNWINEQTQ